MLQELILKWWLQGQVLLDSNLGEKKDYRKTHLRIIQQGRQWVESRIMGCDPIVGLEMNLVDSRKHLKI